MLVPLSPAAIADETTVTPTIEEILNSYHEKAFTAQTAEESSGTSTRSRNGSGSSQTLEQETVDALTAAGYMAYNVTGDNYSTVEETLDTDLSTLGLSPESSYIVVVGSDFPGENTTSNSRKIDPPVQEDFDGDYGSFTHVYGDNTYTMRYVTVTASINSDLGRTSSIELLSEYDVDDAMSDLNLPITILSTLGLIPITGTLYAIASTIFPYNNPAQSDSLDYRGATNWTVTYIQVQDPQTGEWEVRSGFEYATMRYFLTYTYYESFTNQYEQNSTSGTYGTIYSQYYNDRDAINDWAAYAYEHNAILIDKITYVEYSFGENVVITHYRWNEHPSYQPI